MFNNNNKSEEKERERKKRKNRGRQSNLSRFSHRRRPNLTLPQRKDRSRTRPRSNTSGRQSSCSSSSSLLKGSLRKKSRRGRSLGRKQGTASACAHTGETRTTTLARASKEGTPAAGKPRCTRRVKPQRRRPPSKQTTGPTRPYADEFGRRTQVCSRLLHHHHTRRIQVGDPKKQQRTKKNFQKKRKKNYRDLISIWAINYSFKLVELLKWKENSNSLCCWSPIKARVESLQSASPENTGRDEKHRRSDHQEEEEGEGEGEEEGRGLVRHPFPHKKDFLDFFVRALVVNFRSNSQLVWKSLKKSFDNDWLNEIEKGKKKTHTRVVQSVSYPVLDGEVGGSSPKGTEFFGRPSQRRKKWKRRPIWALGKKQSAVTNRLVHNSVVGEATGLWAHRGAPGFGERTAPLKGPVKKAGSL